MIKKPAHHDLSPPKIAAGKAERSMEEIGALSGAARQVPAGSSSGLQAASLLKIAFIFTAAAFFVFIAIRRLIPPSGMPATSPAPEFSSGRAMQRLRIIADKPHPVGSSEHERVRDYILDAVRRLGLTPEAQSNTVISNVIARLDGSGEAHKAIVLVGHYDTVALSPGAADDGYGVATLLETMRALKAGARLKNDVIFLFTDGEEKGLLGAKAFVYNHPWNKDVRVVLNFDARGNSGPMLMFQTSDRNQWLIEQFARAARAPIANSLMADIYGMMPNDTDFTIFKGAGAAGLNFACIGGLYSYHNQSDSLDNCDEGTLQHAGSFALSLARHFGDLDLEHAQQGRAIYFDLLGSVLIFYSERWIIPLAVFASLFFTGIVVFGFLKRRLTSSGIAFGFLALLLSIIGVVVVAAAVQSILGPTARIDPWRRDLYLLGLAVLAVATTAGIYTWLGRGLNIPDMTAGGLLWYLLLTMFSALYAPGGSYLFTWPLLFGLVALGQSVTAKDQTSISWAQAIIFSICAVPGIILLFPIAYLALDALTLRWSAVAMIVIAPSLGSLIPLIRQLSSARKWLLPAGISLAGFVLVAASYS